MRNAACELTHSLHLLCTGSLSMLQRRLLEGNARDLRLVENALGSKPNEFWSRRGAIGPATPAAG
jgi:hypothetical protein